MFKSIVSNFVTVLVIDINGTETEITGNCEIRVKKLKATRATESFDKKSIEGRTRRQVARRGTPHRSTHLGGAFACLLATGTAAIFTSLYLIYYSGPRLIELWLLCASWICASFPLT